MNTIMRYSVVTLVLLTSIFLLGTPSADGQDRKPLMALFGVKADSDAGSNAQKKKRVDAARDRNSSKTSGFFGGPKRVEIDLSAQKLRAYQGNRLVMKTNISSGRNRATPTGRFSAGPYKSAEHYSSLYHNAPMPWSVQVSGNIFIHGFSSVPRYPASHGCIRVPISGSNPARRFFNWVDVGTPIHISY